MTEPINPIPSKYLDKLDPQFIEVYNTHAAFRIRADQASIEEVRANPTKYQATVPPGPTPPVASATIHKIAVDNPPGEIEAKVYIPTSESICAGGLQNAEGKLPAYVNYHGGQFPHPLFPTGAKQQEKEKEKERERKKERKKEDYENI
ncbi:hypothetical protein MPH_08801 [Macrophomina phaseolina MS6]|uniref:Uncharacterized protein n=1 Tax=Macrophomina phaseolina (strain MS6) TaxID=1126212 RepID=K2RV86_MACPH|nr:hypothetical protein MPH_08801 [Macrophomina phaseolina MS6]